MTRLFNDPADFADEADRRFRRRQRALGAPRDRRGGALDPLAPTGRSPSSSAAARATTRPSPDWSGPGWPHGAAMGNVFASPSAQQVYSVAKAADRGGRGAALLRQLRGRRAALRRGRRSGCTPRASTAAPSPSPTTSPAHPPTRSSKRRGIAGDLTVFKVAGAAAEAGLRRSTRSCRVAERANERTRSFGVAFAGCTLPGADDPLFTVPAGRWRSGWASTASPASARPDVPTADGLAETARRARCSRSCPTASTRPTAPGSRYPQRPRHGEVRGAVRRLPRASPRCWTTPASSSSTRGRRTRHQLRHGRRLAHPVLARRRARAPLGGARRHPGLPQGQHRRRRRRVDAERDQPPREAAIARRRPTAPAAAAPGSSPRSTASPPRSTRTPTNSAGIDAVAGDGDHGIGMQRGAHARRHRPRRARVDRGAGAGTVLAAAADAWADRAGGTSGALWGVGLRALGDALRRRRPPRHRRRRGGVAAAAAGSHAFGKAEVGDKTLVDALVPFARRR